MLSQSSRSALPQVIQFSCVERQELGQSLLLPAIEHVALILGDDERKARDLGRKVAQFDAAKIGQRNFRCADPASPRRLLISASIARISL